MVSKQKRQNSECDFLFLFCTHNRVDKTSCFLRSILPQILELKLSYRICMLDDGSTDGTRSLVQDEFPEVEVFCGSGSLFWAGGMRELYKTVSKDISHKHLVVLNDDIKLNKNALKTLLDEYFQLLAMHKNMCMLSATFLDGDTHKISYSGFIRRPYHPLAFKKVSSMGFSLEVDAINMNLSFIPKEVLLECGFLSDCYQHSKADIDYSIMAKNKGARLFISANPAGYCDANPPKKLIGLFNVDWGILANFKNPKGISFPEMYYFYRRNGRAGWQFFLIMAYIKYIHIYIMACIFTLINRLLFQKKI